METEINSFDDIRLLAARGSFAAIDVEGDGNNPQRPVEIGLIEFTRGAETAVHHWILDPGKPMSDFVQKLHGITDAMVAGKPSFHDIEPGFRLLVEGRALVGHKASDDLTMLRAVMPDVDFVPGAVFDTQRLARNLLRGLPRYRLAAVCEALGIDVPSAASSGRQGLHTAVTDARLAAVSFLRMAAMIPAKAKAIRHLSQAARVTMSPKEEAARRAALDASSSFKPGAHP